MTNKYEIFAAAKNPVMAEKDYLECQILETLFSDEFFADNFVFAGGGSITKSYSFSPRVGQDVDLAYGAFIDVLSTRSKKQLNTFRKNFKTFVFDELTPRINKIINQNGEYIILTDREQRVLHNQEQWLSSPTIHVLYRSKIAESLEDIRIEIIPRKYPSEKVSYRAVVPYSIPQLQMGNIPTIAYQQTFWDKIFALHSNSVSTKPHTDAFYSRHYFDVAILSGHIKLVDTAKMFSDIVAYQARYTTKNIGSDLAVRDVNLLPDDRVLYALESDYQQLAARTFCGAAASWNTIVKKLEDLTQDLKRLPNQR